MKTDITRGATGLVAGLLVLGLSSSAWATGFGANFTYAFAKGQMSKFNESIDHETDTYGFGFTLDTNVAANRLLNYRLDVNYEHTNFTGYYNTFTPMGTISGNGGSFNNALGFGLVRTKAVRLWLGPTFRLGGAYYGDTTDLGIVDVAGGVDLGLNVHTGRLVSIGATVGYQYEYSYISNTSNFTQGLSGGSNRARAAITILFRSAGDQFE